MARNLRLTDCDETKETIATTGPAKLDLLHLHNNGAVGVWIHLYDIAAAASVTVGTTVPALSFRLQAGEAREWVGLSFDTGCILAAVTEFHGGATGAATDTVNGSVIVQ